jgi:hypothetical protein
MSANRLMALLWLLVSAGLLVMPLLGVDATTRLYYSNAGQVLVTLASSLYCFATMRAFPAQSPLGKVWGAIGAGLLSWAIAAGIFAAYPILNAGEDTPYPSFADPFYLLAPPLMTIGLILFKRSAGLVSPAWGKALAIAALALFGYFAYLANANGLADSDPFMILVSIGYMLFDPILIAITLLTASAFRGGAVATSWWYVVGGILLYFIANQLYSYLVGIEQYTTGSPIDIGWLLGFGLIACGAVKARKLLG